MCLIQVVFVGCLVVFPYRTVWSMTLLIPVVEQVQSYIQNPLCLYIYTYTLPIHYQSGKSLSPGDNSYATAKSDTTAGRQHVI